METFRNSPDGQHLLLRTKRAAKAQLCKYKKGEWSQCDSLLMLMQRVDKLKQKNSSPDCDQTRRITKNCHEKEERDGGICVFEKPKNVAWSSCEEAGVRRRVLHLIKEKGSVDCPKEKVLSKKCKDQKKKKKKEKCEFGSWSAWSDCEGKERRRQRELLKGNGEKVCMKGSIEKSEC